MTYVINMKEVLCIVCDHCH